MTTPRSLDDPDALASGDPSGMLGLAAGLGAHLHEGYRAAIGTPGIPSADGIRAVVVTGMGGSGVAGDVLRSLFASRLTVPLIASKAATLPGFCDRSTLVLAISFSGDTEETVAAGRGAVERGSPVVVVGSGGELAGLASERQLPWVAVPADVPAPRAAIGYLSGSALGVLQAAGLVRGLDAEIRAARGTLDELAGRWGPGRPTGQNEAKDIAAWLVGRTPVLWGSEGIAEAAALRWKTQMNENAKIPAFSSTLPELDHNEVEGWAAGTGDPFALVVLRHPGEHERIAARVAASLEVVATSGLRSRQARVDAATPMAALFSLIMLGDFASTYLAVARGVDPMPVPVLTSLKARLAVER